MLLTGTAVEMANAKQNVAYRGRFRLRGAAVEKPPRSTAFSPPPILLFGGGNPRSQGFRSTFEKPLDKLFCVCYTDLTILTSEGTF